jgi:hypothetical protein
MKYTTRDLQARVAALGYHPGPIDGLDGPRTRAAVSEALRAHGVTQERALFGVDGLHRIHLHWTAGAYGVIDLELKHYNAIVDQDGGRHRGRWAPEDQAHYRAGVRGASHTLNANTGAIGLSCDAMALARERPFDHGTAPLTWEQVEAMTVWAAEMCAIYWIPVSRYSVLSHAEIQPTLGIRQHNKWDIAWLPDMDGPGDPVAVGDRLRVLIADQLERIERRAA